jgi:hypothetical protein
MTYPDGREYPHFGAGIDQQWGRGNPSETEYERRQRLEWEERHRPAKKTITEINQAARLRAEMDARRAEEARSRGTDSWVSRIQEASAERDRAAEERSREQLTQRQAEQREQLETELARVDRSKPKTLQEQFREEVANAFRRPPAA